MRGDAEQGLCELSDRGNQKILDVLACQNDRGVLLADTLHSVSDIFDCRHVGKEQIQLVDARRRLALTEKLIAHEGQDVEQHGVLEPLVGVHQALHAEDEEVAVRDVGVSVEILGLGTDAHGMDSEAHVLQGVLCIEVLPLLVVAVEFFLAQLVEVLHDREVRGLLRAVVCGVGNAEAGIQLGEQNLNGVDLRIGEILIAAEKVLEESDVLGQPRHLLERFRRGGVDVLNAVRPCLRLEGIDRILAAHEVDIATAQGIAEFLILGLGVQADDCLARLSDIGQNQLEQIALTLAAVAEDQDVACGLILGAAVKVHEDIRAVLVPPDIQSLWVGLAREVERVEVCHAGCGKDSFILRTELIVSGRDHGQESFFLP